MKGLFACNRVNLHLGSLWKGGHLVTYPGRLVCLEVFGVYCVHCAEILDIIQQDSSFHHVVKSQACFFKYVSQIVKGTPRLGFNAFRELAGGGICRKLAGDEKSTVEFNGLRVRSDGSRSLWGSYRFLLIFRILAQYKYF